MASPQQTANEALARWQSLRSEGLTPDQRLQLLVREFFAAPEMLDVEYAIVLRNVAAEMAAA